MNKYVLNMLEQIKTSLKNKVIKDKITIFRSSKKTITFCYLNSNGSYDVFKVNKFLMPLNKKDKEDFLLRINKLKLLDFFLQEDLGVLLNCGQSAISKIINGIKGL